MSNGKEVSRSESVIPRKLLHWEVIEDSDGEKFIAALNKRTNEIMETAVLVDVKYAVIPTGYPGAKPVYCTYSALISWRDK